MAQPTAISRYQIRDRLGHGGMGVLYLALDPAIDRLVAVKLLRVNNPEIRERFIREAQIAARLQHPHIVTVYDVGTHEGQPFIAMEYIAGETMGELIHRRAPLALSRKLELVADVCEGLAYAHKRGVVHRDVKPANLMVGRESGTVKILDFGIARTAGSNLTQVGMVMGTPNYMSPEQIAGQPVDHRSDIFAVGAVLYEVLVSRQAFTADAPHAVLHQITSVEPARVTSLNPDLDPELDDILARAMAKAPADRYADLSAMRADLLHVMQRLEAQQEGHTIVGEIPEAIARLTPTPTPRSGRAGPDRARIAERRAARIASHLQNAEAALAAGALDEALAEVELSAEIAPDDPRIVRLHERVRREIDARDAARLLAEARASLTSGALTEAGRLLAEAGQLAIGSPEVQTLGREIDRAFEQRERAREQARKAREALALARDYLSAGAFDAALRSASEALGYRPDDRDALDVRQSIRDAIDQRNRAAMREARSQAAEGRFDSAIRLLQSLRPADDAVSALVAEVEEAREDAARAQAAREAAERERLLREQAERDRIERERRQREQAERERLERERLAREQAERERLERDRLQHERAERERLERERLAREQAERERQARERAEQERLERERAEDARRRAFEAFIASSMEALDTALVDGRWHDARTALRALDEHAPDAPGLDARRAQLEEGVERERRRLALDRLLAEARSCLGAGEHDEADRAIADALDLDPGDAEARDLRDAVAAARAEAARREQERLELREAQDAADAAVALAQSGDLTAARARLAAAPPLPPIDAARARIAELQARQEEADRARRDAERQAALRAEIEQQRAERLARRPPPTPVPDIERTVEEAASVEEVESTLTDSEDTLETDAPPPAARRSERSGRRPSAKAPSQTPARPTPSRQTPARQTPSRPTPSRPTPSRDTGSAPVLPAPTPTPLDVIPRPLTSAPAAERGRLADRPKLAIIAAAIVATLLGGWLVVRSLSSRVDDDGRARLAVQDARARFERGDQGGAVGMLEQYQPGHPLVQQALDELRQRQAAAAAPQAPATANPSAEPATPPAAAPPETPPSAAPPPAATPTDAKVTQPDAQQTASQEAARQALLALSRGDLDGAMGHAVQGLRADPRNTALQSARDRTLAGARQRAETAQQRSLSAGASGQAAHVQAADQMSRADQRQITAPVEAVRLYLDAEGSFTKAIATQRAADDQVRQARALETWVAGRLAEAGRAIAAERWNDASAIVNEVRARAPGTQGLDELARRIETGRRVRLAAPTTPTPPPTQAVPPSAATGDVQREVGAMFGQYLASYTARDARRVAELHPSIPANIADTFRQVTEWEVSCGNVTWTQITAARATFVCSWHIVYKRTRGGGTPPPVSLNATFTATRTEGRWIITERVFK